MLKMINPAQALQITAAENMRVSIWLNSLMREKELLLRIERSPIMQKILQDHEEKKQEEHVTPVSVHI